MKNVFLVFPIVLHRSDVHQKALLENEELLVLQNDIERTNGYNPMTSLQDNRI